jgi:hypothetical protein
MKPQPLPFISGRQVSRDYSSVSTILTLGVVIKPYREIKCNASQVWYQLVLQYCSFLKKEPKTVALRGFNEFMVYL